MTTNPTDAKTLLKYANLQMAAEAFLSDKTAPVRTTNSDPITLAKLTTGNERSSKFTKTQAAEFIQDWKSRVRSPILHSN
jgi:hypothetical protein